jgi:hypothetical protein
MHLVGSPLEFSRMSWLFIVAEMPRNSYLTIVRGPKPSESRCGYKFRIHAENSGEAGLISSTNLNLSGTGSFALFEEKQITRTHEKANPGRVHDIESRCHTDGQKRQRTIEPLLPRDRTV